MPGSARQTRPVHISMDVALPPITDWLAWIWKVSQRNAPGAIRGHCIDGDSGKAQCWLHSAGCTRVLSHGYLLPTNVPGVGYGFVPTRYRRNMKPGRQPSHIIPSRAAWARVPWTSALGERLQCPGRCHEPAPRLSRKQQKTLCQGALNRRLQCHAGTCNA